MISWFIYILHRIDTLIHGYNGHNLFNSLGLMKVVQGEIGVEWMDGKKERGIQ